MDYEWWLLSNYEQLAMGQAMARNKELSKEKILEDMKGEENENAIETNL